MSENTFIVQNSDMNLDNFYLSKGEPNRSCMLALRQLILAQDDEVWETVKYGAPCFMFRKRMFAYILVEKKSNKPYILVVEGNRIDHPKLEQGDRKRMKIYRVDPYEDINVEEIEAILKVALDFYRNGVIKS